MRRRFLAIAGFVAMASSVGSAMAQTASMILPEEWSAYQAAFIGADGRVVDTGNAGISHSEGQGYGLLLAVLAGDRASFERIWSFTRTELMVRDDGLAAWRWEADRTPHIADANNATDGDMLIAYALALAGKAWDDPDKTKAATALVQTIGDTLIGDFEGLATIAPAAAGFSAEDRPDGPVINPSYWVFEAFPVFAQLTPGIDWQKVASDGLELLHRARIYPAMLPPDWVSLQGGDIRPADGFPPEFGYNNVRIPLYMMRAGVDARYLKPYDEIGNAEGLGRVQVTTNTVMERLGEPGYRLIQAAVDCTLKATPIPAELQTLTASTYYAATLQLLLLDHLRRNQPECLGVEAKP